MNKKLYVGNLSYDTTENSLRTLFSEAGQVVEATIIQDRDTGRSKGFGFVEMADEDSAAAAVEQLNGRQVDGRALNVAEARPPRERDDRGGGGSRGGSRGGGGRSRW